MVWTPRVIIAVVLSVGGLAGMVVFLTGQGLDRAEKWVSLVGVFGSLAVGVAGLTMGWLTWRKTTSGAAAGRVSRTGSATAAGPGSSAISGTVGLASGAVVDRTGDATATGGGQAVSGEDRSGKQT